MKNYILRRVARLAAMLFFITFVSFAMMRAAGSDAVEQRMESVGMASSQEVVDAERSELGLDRPFLAQYFSWLKNLALGDAGVSFVSRRPVFETFMSRLPATLLLAAVSLAITILVSVPLGIFAAARQNSFFDAAIRLCSFVGNSLPNFFVALLLMYFFSVRLKIFPVISSGISARSVALPSLALAIAMSAKYIRQVRAIFLDELKSDYVTGERARGIPFSATLTKSVLRASLSSIVTLLALSAGSLLGGAAIVETIFTWDGVGKLAVDAIKMRDYPVVQAYVLWMGIIYVCLSAAADVACCALDPRIRLGGEKK